MLACVEKNDYSEQDSVDDILMKNQTIKEKLNILIGTIEDQLAVMGHDMSSFFDSINESAETPPSGSNSATL